MTIAACYFAVQMCVGLLAHQPRVLVWDSDRIPCQMLKGKCVDAACTQRYDGTCSGLYKSRQHRVVVGNDERSLAHEFIHSLIGDPRHERVEWRCQSVCQQDWADWIKPSGASNLDSDVWNQIRAESPAATPAAPCSVRSGNYATP